MSTHPSTQQVAVPDSSASDSSVGELIRLLSEQTSRLARQEAELAKTELVAKGRRVGVGAGMLGGAGLFGLYAAGALVAAATLGLATAVVAWLAALIVAAVLAAVAGVLALQGRTKVQQATPPIPEQAGESVKEDVRVAKQSAEDGRR